MSTFNKYAALREEDEDYDDGIRTKNLDDDDYGDDGSDLDDFVVGEYDDEEGGYLDEEEQRAIQEGRLYGASHAGIKRKRKDFGQGNRPQKRKPMPPPDDRTGNIGKAFVSGLISDASGSSHLDKKEAAAAAAQSDDFVKNLLQNLQSDPLNVSAKAHAPSMVSQVRKSLRKKQNAEDLAMFSTSSVLPSITDSEDTHPSYGLPPAAPGMQQQQSHRTRVDSTSSRPSTDSFHNPVADEGHSAASNETLRKDDGAMSSPPSITRTPAHGLSAVTPPAASSAPKSTPNTSSDWFSLSEQSASTVHTSPATTASASFLSSRPSADLIPTDKQAMTFYWIDAIEDMFSHSGTVYLFGKVYIPSSKSYESICVHIQAVPRCVYFSPKEPDRLDLASCMEEVSQMCSKCGIRKHGVKIVKRKYAFENASVVRDECQWLKLKYDAQFGALSSFDAANSENFSAAFGTHQSLLELFLIKRNVMGPCWLTLKKFDAVDQPLSWCKFEVRVLSPKDVIVSPLQPPAPPLRVLALSFKTVRGDKQHHHEVVVASGIHVDGVSADGPTPNWDRKLNSFTVVRKADPDTPFPIDFAGAKHRIELCGNEKALLAYLVAKIHSIDPDVIVGHNFCAFDLDMLLHRFKALKTPHWSRIGRLMRKEVPQSSSSAFADRQVMAGRLIADTALAAREYLREKSFQLGSIALTQLGINREEIDSSIAMFKSLFSKSEHLVYIARHCENDGFIMLSLLFKLMLLPLTKELTCVAGNLWTRTLQGGRAERIEYLLMHEFHRRKYVVPDKPVPVWKKGGQKKDELSLEREFFDDDDEEGGQTTKQVAKEDKKDEGAAAAKGKRNPKYAGGLVLEPKKGFYDKFVLLLDFNSLYPSIIREYNICFTTVKRPRRASDGSWLEKAVLPDASAPSVLPYVISRLVDQRREVKNLLKAEKDPLKQEQLEIRQKALKLTANSMYGCLGFSHSRFNAQPLAELITSTGRETLQHAVDIAQGKLSLEVIYGDTDSVMIHTNSRVLDEAKKMGEALKREINKLYKHLEIDIDGVFQCMLLLRKKKYAALRVVPTGGDSFTVKEEMKGLDMVRRDWCPLSAECSRSVLTKMLSGEPREEVVDFIHNHLRELGDAVRANQIQLNKFVITKGLAKPPEEYPDKRSQPHVQVALRLKASGKAVNVGDRIEYVICREAGVGNSKPEGSGENQPVSNSSTSYAERAYHPEEIVKAAGALTIDVDWYLSQQVHPPLARLCEHLEGINSAILADCLGLDSGRYRSIAAASHGDEEDELAGTSLSLQDRMNRYRENALYPLEFTCPHCSHPSSFLGVADYISQRVVRADVTSSNLFMCPSCRRSMTDHAGSLELQFRNLIRKCIGKYYEGWVHCEEPSCQYRTRLRDARIARGLAKPVSGKHGVSVGLCPRPECRAPLFESFSGRQLFNELKYLEFLVDVKGAESIILEQVRASRKDAKVEHVQGLAMSQKDEQACSMFQTAITNFLNHHSRNYVQLESLFGIFL
nr:DNA polymerase alpha catalytic subunit [Andalucia godoyi]|eukprot:ANDGO_06063.mRNA.1 DNA polymerase alpha catalytic subunit